MPLEGKYLNCYKSLLHLKEASGTASYLKIRLKSTQYIYIIHRITIYTLPQKQRNYILPVEF